MPPNNRELAFAINDVARLLRTFADHEARRFGMTRAKWAVLARLVRFEVLKQAELAGVKENLKTAIANRADKPAAKAAAA